MIGAMDSKTWLPAELGDELIELISKRYPHLLQLDAVLDCKDEIIDMVSTLLREEGIYEASSAAQLTSVLWKWRSEVTPVVKRLRRELVRTCRESRLLRVEDSVSASSSAYVRPPLPKVIRTHNRSNLSKQIAADPTMAERHQAEEKERWTRELVKIIEEAMMPVVDMVHSTTDPQATWSRLFGSRRAKTLRNRARSWRPVREWLLMAKGRPFPNSASDMLDYLNCLAESKVGKSVPESVMASLSVLETVGDPQGRHLSNDASILAALRSVKMQLETGSKPRKQAETYTVAMIIALEVQVGCLAYSIPIRVYSWIILLMIWSSLRVSDLSGVDAARLGITDQCFRGVLTVTKTTGPGKKILESPFFVHRAVPLSGYDWLGKGFELWQKSFIERKGGFFLLDCNDQMRSFTQKEMSLEKFTGVMRGVLKCLGTPVRPTLGNDAWKVDISRKLVPEELQNFWTGHSPRHVLPTIAAAMGFRKEERDFLGRWGVGQHQSNEYVLSARQIVLDIQRKVSQALSEHVPDRCYDETEVLERFQAFAVYKVLHPDVIRKRHEVLMKTSNGYNLVQSFPMVSSAQSTSLVPEDLFHSTELIDSGNLIEPDGFEPKKEEAKFAPYFVVVGRGGFKRMHKSNMCSTFPWNCKKVIECWSVDEIVVDSVCKFCSKYINPRAVEDSSSSSGESSTDVEAEAVEEEVLGPSEFVEEAGVEIIN